MNGQRLASIVVTVLVGLGSTFIAGLVAQEGSARTTDGWRQAARGYTMAFPRDHGSHPDYRIEWWYYTGNLASADGGATATR